MLLPNSIEGKAEPFLKRVETLMAEIESERGTYMSLAKSLREDIKNVYVEARDQGVPGKALKGLVRYRELDRKQRAIGAGLDIDEQSTYEQLVEALGDFASSPLGAATLDVAKRKRGRPRKANGDVEAIRAATQAELEEPLDEIDQSYHERLAQVGTEPSSARVIS
jgi:uncharacterized protein (UPF0335 family)